MSQESVLLTVSSRKYMTNFTPVPHIFILQDIIKWKSLKETCILNNGTDSYKDGSRPVSVKGPPLFS
jgi:hypothetical protein